MLFPPANSNITAECQIIAGRHRWITNAYCLPPSHTITRTGGLDSHGHPLLISSGHGPPAWPRSQMSRCVVRHGAGSLSVATCSTRDG
jgi:hypothetical protein